MKKLTVLFLMLFLCSCSSFGRGLVEGLLNKKNEDTRQCEIRGNSFAGIAESFAKGKTVKILMVHGVGTHQAGYSTRIMEGLAKDLGLNVMSKRHKDIALTDPQDKSTPIGNLRVIKLQNEEKTKEMFFYELTWSVITEPQKQFLRYDVSGQYAYKRAEFNNLMKEFLNDKAPDPMIYLVDNKHLILNSVKQSFCWMLSSPWNNLKTQNSGICKIASIDQIKNFNNEKIIFITHSLGSIILTDAFEEVVKEVSKDKIRNSHVGKQVVKDLQGKTLTVFMLANQLPMLRIGRQKPQVHNQFEEYCLKGGPFYGNRVFNKTNIIAFSDPNDVLSYAVQQSFVDDYVDSRMCPNVTNVSINIAPKMSAFDVGFANPLEAHVGYDKDERVVDMIANGFNAKNKENLATKRCSFIKLED